tara:strand:+ start:304 stop:804 length:501 start_codon:yes stop_codon:yes gene_type:complete
MIISCTNCNKKFEINSDLIPDSGRLLVCGSCNNEWFYTKEKLVDETTQINKETDLISKDDKEINDLSENKQNEVNINLSESNEDFINEEDEISLKNEVQIKKINNRLRPNILSLVLLFIISSIAIIILIDTFKSQISLIIPNIELILFNLYETLKDILLFSKDLIR